LDAKRTKDVNSTQQCGELVHLPASSTSHSDRCCLRLVPEGPAPESGAVAA
jgi:hypothetical protein